MADSTSIDQLFESARDATDRADARYRQCTDLVAASRDRLDKSADLLHSTGEHEGHLLEEGAFGRLVEPLVSR